jgi:adenosylhomocysteine nucleosidase
MIGIIAAMHEEAAYLIEHMQNKLTTEIAKTVFTSGTLNGMPVAMVECGIGKVNAAIGTTLLIEHFKPDCVINTGTAGGLNPALTMGDVVISTDVTHHDVDLTVWGYAHGQLPKLPAAFLPDLSLIEAAERAALNMNMHVTKGLIVSGDSFISTENTIARILALFPAVQAVEMEAAAIAQVCHQFSVPFVIIRAISDVAGKDSVLSFDAFLKQAAQNSAQLLLNTLSEWSHAKNQC